jgi:hypothetical protein
VLYALRRRTRSPLTETIAAALRHHVKSLRLQ